MKQQDKEINIFECIKSNIEFIDPVTWAENNLTLDGNPFSMKGYEPLKDIYRYIGIKAIERENSKPICIVKSRQIGMTIASAVLSLYFTASGNFGKHNPPMQVAHTFPLLELASSYSKAKLATIIASAKPSGNARQNGKSRSVIEDKIDRTLPSSDNLTFKQFENGNQLWIESIGLNGNRLMGKSISVLLNDESASSRKNALGNATKTLNQAKYGLPGKGIQVYFGTPLQSGSYFWNQWEKSNKQYYRPKCTSCNEYFEFFNGDPESWEKIWIFENTLKCPLCEEHINRLEAIKQGKWVASVTDSNVEYVGYHINMLYNPTFTREMIEAEKPENSVINTKRAYYNECLGLFYNPGNGSMITIDEIHENCADFERPMVKTIPYSDKQKIAIGFDWGQLDFNEDIKPMKEGEESTKQRGQSYSTAVVIKQEEPHIITVEYCFRFLKNDTKYRKDVVEELMVRYKPNLCVGDIGDAFNLSEDLSKLYGPKYLTSRSVSQIKDHIRFDAEIFPKEIKFEKDYYIRQTFEKMKKGLIKFPFKPTTWESFAWLLDDITSMEVKFTTDKWGETNAPKFIKGNKQNDGLMALINAILALNYLNSDGFKINDPNKMNLDPKKKNEIPVVLGYVPRL